MGLRSTLRAEILEVNHLCRVTQLVVVEVEALVVHRIVFLFANLGLEVLQARGQYASGRLGLAGLWGKVRDDVVQVGASGVWNFTYEDGGP